MTLIEKTGLPKPRTDTLRSGSRTSVKELLLKENLDQGGAVLESRTNQAVQVHFSKLETQRHRLTSAGIGLLEGGALLEVVGEGMEEQIRTLESLQKISREATQKEISPERRKDLESNRVSVQKKFNENVSEFQYEGFRVLSGEIRKAVIPLKTESGIKDIPIEIEPMKAEDLEIKNLDLSSPEKADESLKKVDRALKKMKAKYQDFMKTEKRIKEASKKVSDELQRIVEAQGALSASFSVQTARSIPVEELRSTHQNHSYLLSQLFHLV